MLDFTLYFWYAFHWLIIKFSQAQTNKYKHIKLIYCQHKKHIWHLQEYQTGPPNSHCTKSILIRSFSGPHFPEFGLNTERYGVSLQIQSECGKMRTTITPNRDTFHAVSKLNYNYRLTNYVYFNSVIYWIIDPADPVIFHNVALFWNLLRRGLLTCSSFGIITCKLLVNLTVGVVICHLTNYVYFNSFIYWFIGKLIMIETLCNSFSKLKEIQILFSNLKLGCFSLPKIQSN